MLQEFWNYFMTTGQINMYLDYKAYEKEKASESSYQCISKEELG